MQRALHIYRTYSQRFFRVSYYTSISGSVSEK